MALKLIATRVDDRLIHGQGLVWLKSLPINTVVVVNDDVAKSEMQQDLMLSLVPATVDARFFSVDKTIKIIHKAADRQQIFLLFKTLDDAWKCIENGVKIAKLNIGNVRKRSDTKKISPYVNLTDDELDIIEKMLQKGIKLDAKQTPMGAARGEEINFRRLIEMKHH